MRVDGTFIGIELTEGVVADPELARRLDELCPVDIYAATPEGVQIVDDNVDECILCQLCLDVRPGEVVVHKLYSEEVLGS